MIFTRDGIVIIHG